MKKWNLILVSIISLVSLTVFAADLEPQPIQDQQQAEVKEQKEAMEEAAEAQREAMEAQQEAQEEAREAMLEAQQDAQEAQKDALEAQKDIQEGLKEAQKGLVEAQKQLRKTGINISLPYVTSLSGFTSQSDVSTLLIPDKPMEAEILGQLSEDLQVMALVLEEKIGQDNNAYGYGEGGFSTGRSWVYRMTGLGSIRPSAMYLGGYGMIFRLGVDYPLIMLKGGQEKQEGTLQDKKDEVWQRSKDKLKGMDIIEKEKDEDSAPVYDPDKVKQLQKDLTEALIHAANIRNLSDREQVIIVVRTFTDGKPLSKDEQSNSNQDKEPSDTMSVPTSVMILRASKQDIDAYAADKLNFDKFAEKVSVLIY